MRHTHEVIGNLRELRLAMETVDGKDQEAPQANRSGSGGGHSRCQNLPPRGGDCVADGTGCDAFNPNSECVGTAVKEFRGALVRPFANGRMDAGVNFLIASGCTGQTAENFYPSDVQQVVGARVPSYASLSLTYRFRHRR